MLPESTPVTLFVPSASGWNITSSFQSWPWVFGLVDSYRQQAPLPEWAGGYPSVAPYGLAPDGTSVLAAGGVVLSLPAMLSLSRIEQLCEGLAYAAYLPPASTGLSPWLVLIPTSRIVSGQEYTVLVDRLYQRAGLSSPGSAPLVLPLPLQRAGDFYVARGVGGSLQVDPILSAATPSEPEGAPTSAVVAPGEGQALPAEDAQREHEIQFPLSARIGLFADYMDLVEGSTESPTCFAWGAFAACFSVLLGRTFTLPSGASSTPPTLHVGLVGTTSLARKSSAIGDALDIVLAPFAAEPSGPPSAQIQVVRGSGSGEGFAEALADCKVASEGRDGADKHDRKRSEQVLTGRRAIYVVDELGSLLGKVNRDQAGNMVEFVIGTFDARQTWSHRTRGKGSTQALQMTNATGVFLCASTYEWLTESMTSTQVMAGLTNRFLWLTGTSTRLIHRRPEIPKERIAAFQAKLGEALARLIPGSFRVTAEADALHKRQYMAYRQHPALDKLTGAATGRSDALVLRIAMLLAASEATTIIDVQHIRAAWEVVMYSNYVATSIVEKLEMKNLRESQARVEKAIQALVRAGKAPFSRRDIYQRVKGTTGMDAETFNRVFRGLVEAEMLVKDGVGNRYKWTGDG